MRPVAILNVVAAALLAGVIGSRSMQATVVETTTAGGGQAQTAPPTPPAGYVGAEACATCHTGYDASIRSSRHGQAQDPRTPAAAQGCETCHGPGEAHASDPEKVKPVQFDRLAAREVTDSCTTCHNRGPHALWKGSQHEARNVSCVSCHSVHQPKSAKAQLKTVDQQQQCMSCHRDKVAKLDRSGHMPVREGKMECSSCHNPHGSTNVRLLKTGNSINEACSSCHAEKRGPLPVRARRHQRRQLRHLPRPARLEQRPDAGRQAAVPVPALPQPHAPSLDDLRRQGPADQQPPLRPVVRDLPFGHPRLEPPGWFDLPAAVRRPTVQTRTVLAAVLVVLAAGAATAQEPPSLPAPTDPVAVGRSELSGKVYGAVDFGGRISSRRRRRSALPALSRPAQRHLRHEHAGRAPHRRTG